ncbi:unnamed protein product, partial [Darwinula stevensoni]
MPGMMDTVLNLGLNDETIKGLIEQTGNERFAYDAYRRLVMMYADVVMEKAAGIEPKGGKGIRRVLEDILEDVKHKHGYQIDTELTADDLKHLVSVFKRKVKETLGQAFPEDPIDQLWGGIGAVFGSWQGKRAVEYRRIEKIPDEWGTAVNVQAMVFGNMGSNCATGVAFTRNPGTGDDHFYGEFLINAQGEDVVAGTETDADGNYFLSDVQPGTYDMEASYVGYTTQRQTGIIIKAGRTNRVNFVLTDDANILDLGIEIKVYKIPLIEIDNTTQGTTVTAEKIRALPTKQINAIAATSAGLSSRDGGDISIRGSRSNETVYFLDGVRVTGNLIPQSEIEQLQVVIGGIEARYGDVTGGVISLTSRGPSSTVTGSLEMEKSFDGYGYNLLSGFREDIGEFALHPDINPILGSYNAIAGVNVNGLLNQNINTAWNNLYANVGQDKFSYKDIIFRLGMRVDYFDANTKVLRDPYALYEIESAKDYYARIGQAKPTSVGDDY